MPQSHAGIYVHFIFSTRDRAPLLRESGLRSEMHRVLNGISRDLNSEAIQIGGVEDHVHALVRLNRTVSCSDWVKESKRRSSMWAKRRDPSLADFGWQSGFGAFSLSRGGIEATTHYILNQEEHHRRVSFKEEYLSFLAEHEIEYDPRYIWE